jgi:hypothetical protein
MHDNEVASTQLSSYLPLAAQCRSPLSLPPTRQLHNHHWPIGSSSGLAEAGGAAASCGPALWTLCLPAGCCCPRLPWRRRRRPGPPKPRGPCGVVKRLHRTTGRRRGVPHPRSSAAACPAAAAVAESFLNRRCLPLTVTPHTHSALSTTNTKHRHGLTRAGGPVKHSHVTGGGTA